MYYITPIEKLFISEECIHSFLDKVSLPKLKGAITERELLKALTSMDNGKLPGNDGITKEILHTVLECC